MPGSQAAVAASFARERWLLPGVYDAARARALERFLREDLPRASFYAGLAGRPLGDLPVVDKRTVLADFAAFNRYGITLEQALAVAEAAERSRDFTATLPGGVTVGLSSGTTGTRGVFLVSEQESRLWAGILLGQMMAPASLRVLARRPLRVALFLRANSNLYETLDSRRVAFSWHDLTVPVEDHLPDLPGTDVLVAPASVLRRIAASKPAGLRPIQVISVAETLDPEDEAVIRGSFGLPVEQIYQATEGLLAVSCPAGRLHLNEGHVHIEPEWIDHRRFHPVVTDFTRTTQLVVRHRLDDVLLAAPGPCPCGRPGRSIAAVLGRADDVLTLAGDGGAVPVWPDALRHAVALAGELGDYRIEQHGDEWRVAVTGLPAGISRVGVEIERLAERLRARPPVVVPMGWPVEAPDQKRRRIRRVS
ncbi:putative adenylate-forming enzyme [Nocardioides aromaticivorans]|uniref:Putative adenylate-forming enzyme n=1 Tax=Nocardioides aromaticivorans TaxID=200618 RepID=A0A7Y9ZJU6_9ACTN|nr:F390 synthetase-related protein [Nocardioides aromaticivorans]NYI45668.1 putative adenylate-forming enzyme [Nocardioides aromaticivorans]